MYKFCLLVLSLIITPQAHAFDQQMLIKVFFNIVQVHTANNSNTDMGLGSGVIVADNRVLTNCHVLKKAETAWVSQGESNYSVEGVQINGHQDLCLLTTKDMPLKPADIGSIKDLKTGTEVFAIGHSSGISAPTTSRGQIKALYPFEGSQIIRSSARFSMGASGSGLFDDQGKLVGINTFKSFGRIAYFYAMPADWIENLKTLPLQPIAPFAQTAFWEDGEHSPFFLQAAMPEIQNRWPDLLKVSQSWIASEPDNAEAWYEQGLAQEGLGLDEAARLSYEKTTALNQRHSDALFHLGMLASKRGDRTEVHKISIALADIGSEIAEDFNLATGCDQRTTSDC
ncbi:MAG: trypsin-like peptidase domain-containing protein [Pseudomonadota bacterium]